MTTAASPGYGKEIWNKVDRIVAIGDVHGDYEQYLTILKDNNLIDSKLNWTGAKTHLVQLGDVPDRGADSLKIMRHLKQLQKQARKKGGYVHALLGNHEVMNVDGDLRYVHPGEYKILVNRKSARLQNNYIAEVIDYLDNSDPVLNTNTNTNTNTNRESQLAELEKTYPLGYVEHRRLWAPRGEFFEWIKGHNTVIKINRTLFVHGGISPHIPSIPLKKINRRIRDYLKYHSNTMIDAIDDLNGPLWYRGLAVNSAEDELEPLKSMLKFYDADTIVIAHTPTAGQIIPRMGRRVIQADVGLSRFYNSGRAALVIENGEYYAIHKGAKVSIPDDDKSIETYLAKLAIINTNSSQKANE
jgi:hypothetical protein